MQTKRVQTDIKTYCDGVFDLYPRYNKYLSLNNKISDYILEIYYNENIEKKYKYVTDFDEFESIELACEIIGSISQDLKEKFIEYINDGGVHILDDCISGTYINNTKIESSIKKTNTIVDPITIVHEFMHYIHLEKYGDIYYEDYYYFTEILGLVGDFYSIFYLENNKPELFDDVKAYLSESICSLASFADRTLPFGMVLDIYKNKHSLSKLAFLTYMKTNKISMKFFNVLNHYKPNEHFNYHEDVRYVFALPIAYKISKDIFTKKYKFYEYKEVFDKLPCINVEKCLNILNLDSHFENDEALKLIMGEILTDFVNLYDKEKNKVKKYGDL